MSFQDNWVSGKTAQFARKIVLLVNAVLVEDVGVMHSCLTVTYNLTFALNSLSSKFSEPKCIYLL